MRIAYLILTHKNPEQAARLVARLNAEGVSFFIHVDGNVPPDEYARFQDRLTAAAENVFFVPRHRCLWGDFSLVAAALSCLDALTASQRPFDTALLLSGQDYPIQTNRHIREFLSARAGCSFVDYHVFPHPAWFAGGFDRLGLWNFRPFYRFQARLRNTRFHAPLWRAILRLGLARRFPPGLTPYGGSQWWALSREAVQYIARFRQENPGFARFFRHAFCADEIFFQTILLNGPLKERVVCDNLRLLYWEGARTRVLTEREQDNIAASPALFARKFDTFVDAGILDRVDALLAARGESAAAVAARHEAAPPAGMV